MKTVPAFVHRPAGKSRRVEVKRAPDGRIKDYPIAPLGWVEVKVEEA